MANVMKRQASTLDVAEVARVIGEAFAPLPAAEWLVPQREERVDALAGQFAILVEHAHTYGDVDVVCDEGGIIAAAVWLDYTADMPEPPDYGNRLQAACGRWTDRFRRLDELFAQHHPHAPHHHLALLAVRPERQRRGVGTALLARHHEHLDRYAIGGYLEASSTASRDLYLRTGYQPHGEPFDLTDGARFWPLWRRPTPTSTLGGGAR
jgi:GNAT superfamily N-acetyltransferase